MTTKREENRTLNHCPAMAKSISSRSSGKPGPSTVRQVHEALDKGNGYTTTAESRCS